MGKIRSAVLALLLGVVAMFMMPAFSSAEPVSPKGVAVSFSHAGIAADSVAPVLAQAPGPVIDPEVTKEADAKQTQRKIVVGVGAAILLGTVIWGRHVRKKRRVAAQATS